MTPKAWKRMIRKMRKYVAQGRTFNQFRNESGCGYPIAWSTMLRGWKVAEIQVNGRAKSQDRIITYKISG